MNLLPKFAPALLLLCVLQAAVMAQHDVPDQPVQEVFQTELVYPQEKGELQLTLGTTFHRNSAWNAFRTPVSLEYGLTNRWQVGFEWDASSFKREFDDAEYQRGIGDLRLETKYSFMNIAGSSYHAAIGFEVQLPTANVRKGLTEGCVEYEPFVAVARDFPSLNRTQIFAHVGLGLMQRVKTADEGDELEPVAHELNVNTGVFVPFRKARFTAEVNWETNRWNNHGDESALYFTPGVIFQPASNWEFGFGVPVGATRSADNVRAIFKFVREF